MTTLHERAWKVQHGLEARIHAVGRGKYARVLRMARKPTADEYVKVIRVTSAGLAVIGAVGFLIYLLMRLLPTID